VSAVLAVGLLVLGLARAAAAVGGVPFDHFTRDATAVAEVPWYTGSISLLTCMVWGVAAALSVFVAWAAPRTRRRMLALGVFTAFLGADDALLFHDQVGPAHGVPEKLFPAVYGVLALVLLVQMLKGSTRATVGAFLLGGALLAVSVLVDVAFTDQSFIIEDGAKLLGAMVWATVPVLTFAADRPTEEAAATAHRTGAHALTR
jgi:hypothetical protein